MYEYLMYPDFTFLPALWGSVIMCEYIYMMVYVSDFFFLM